MMIDYDLDPDEKEILEAYERGEFVEVPDIEEAKKKAKSSARATLNKTRNINIRLSERDLYKLKRKAIEEGIPYQTLASSILHKATANHNQIVVTNSILARAEGFDLAGKSK